jgi:hypothetical protein
MINTILFLRNLVWQLLCLVKQTITALKNQNGLPRKLKGQGRNKQHNEPRMKKAAARHISVKTVSFCPLCFPMDDEIQ